MIHQTFAKNFEFFDLDNNFAKLSDRVMKLPVNELYYSENNPAQYFMYVNPSAPVLSPMQDQLLRS